MNPTDLIPLLTAAASAPIWIALVKWLQHRSEVSSQRSLTDDERQEQRLTRVEALRESELSQSRSEMLNRISTLESKVTALESLRDNLQQSLIEATALIAQYRAELTLCQQTRSAAEQRLAKLEASLQQ